jgi:acetolactate synthase-1/2/3 large subunit
VGGEALFGRLRELAGKIASKAGCRLMADTLVSRISKGAGSAKIEQLVYPITPKIAQMEQVTSMTLIGTNRPVAFFAYPDKPSVPESPECAISELCTPTMDIAWTMKVLADAVGVNSQAQFQSYALDLPEVPSGQLTLDKIGRALAALMPENAVLCNEAITSGAKVMPPTLTANPHEVLGGTGGAIGFSLPCAVGAAIACLDRKVISLTGDGSAMYTLQSLWTMARESLDITVIIFANRGYQVLREELVNVGVKSYGQNASAMFDVENPLIDWLSLARGHGVPGMRAENMESFSRGLKTALQSEGPYLIEVVCP